MRIQDFFCIFFVEKCHELGECTIGYRVLGARLTTYRGGGNVIGGY